MRKASIRGGQKVLVIGGGGAIGSYGVMLAKLYGAEVTAVDSTAKLDMLHSIAALIDYTVGPYLRKGPKYDVIFDTVYQSSYSDCINALADGGVYLMANTGPQRMLRTILTSFISNKKTIFQFAAETREDLNYLSNLIATGKLTPYIDRTYPLDKTPEAHAYVQSGNKRGCIVIKIQ